MMSDVLSQIDLMAMLKTLERNMTSAMAKKEIADIKYKAYIERRDELESLLKKYSKRKGKSIPELDLVEESLEEYEQDDFIVGEHLQVFPMLSDGGLLSNGTEMCYTADLYSFPQLFTSKMHL